MTRREVLAAALAALDAGRGVALATVVAAQGSTPRHLGARMVVADDGETWGTVGGGRIEQVTVAAALEVARGAEPHAIRQHLVRDLAMCCGGSMSIALSPGRASRDALASVLAARAGCVVATPIEGGALSARAPRDGDPSAARVIVADGVLVERIGGGERVVMFGLGHVARALGPLLAQLDYDVIVCDDDDTGALATAPIWGRVIATFEVAAVEAALGSSLGQGDHVLIITRDHAIDQRLLEQLIARADELAYLGMIGSRGKVLRFAKRLAAKQLISEHGDDARWRRLRAPIGLDIGAETPEEIAIAIAAELIALRRRGVTHAGAWEPHV